MSPANTTVNWSYTWSAAGSGAVKILSRATDDSANTETPGPGVSVTVNCPCGLFGASYVPGIPSTSDPAAYELGMKFQSAVSGWVAGVRFYKGTGNNGTHTGSLWSASGTQLATGTFTSETASGWQTMKFTNPVAIAASTTYVVSYYDPNGNYASDLEKFDSQLTTPPLIAPRAVYTSAGGGNGVFNSAFSLLDILADDQNHELSGSPLSQVGRQDGTSQADVPVPSLIHSWGGTGPSSMSLTSSTRVACNEVTEPNPKDADGVGIFKWGWAELVGPP